MARVDHTFNSSQQPHDIEGHKLISFFPLPAAAGSTTATAVGSGEGVSGGEGKVVTSGAGIPGFSTTSIRLASCGKTKPMLVYGVVSLNNFTITVVIVGGNAISKSRNVN